MLKRTLFLFAAFLMTVSLAACGDSNESSNSDSNQNTSENESSNNNAEAEDDDTEAHEVGETISNEAGDSTLVSRTDDVGTFDSGPISLEIEKANGVHMDVTNDEYVDIFESEELEYIQVDMNVENTSEDHIEFYASQAKMTTDTGEQIEPDMILSDHIDGEYLGEVSKSGTSFYMLEDSKAEDVESIKLFYSAPNDENFESVGEDIEIDIDLAR